ncbi:MAG TPA: PhoU domain-containing protein, partial [Candidatus Binataceae bacterium]|nr:PhoU domain-containing protein [Candidatus Binataceae bacterium]
MERHFEQDLNELKERLLWMASLAERAVHRAMQAVFEKNQTLAQQVLDEEKIINDMQIEIDDRVMRLVALQAPMAVDLRFLLSASRINNDLERIGDQG